jgi:hypothetical protein
MLKKMSIQTLKKEKLVGKRDAERKIAQAGRLR